MELDAHAGDKREPGAGSGYADRGGSNNKSVLAFLGAELGDPGIPIHTRISRLD